MSSALNESFAFSMLSRLPPASFVVEQRQFDVAIQPQNGVYEIDRDHLLDIYLRGATNEFALMGYATVDGQTALTVDVSSVALLSALAPSAVRRALCQSDLHDMNIRWQQGPCIFDSSRESVNSGQVPILENSDKSQHLVINNARCLAAKRNLRQGRRSLGLESENHFTQDIDDLASAGWSDDASYRGINIWYQNPAGAYRRVDNGVKNWSVPLALYSALAAAHTVLPLGLMSAYAVNGLGIRFSIPNFARHNSDPDVALIKGLAADGNRSNNFLFFPENVTAYGFQNLVGSVVQAQGDGTRNVRITMPVVRVLDPAVMQAVLSLYEKRSQVNVGGVSFPMSLRLNTIGYRFYDFPLDSQRADFYFRLPTTDRSVRGAKWFLYNSRDDKVPLQRAGQGCNKLTRLEVKAGSLNPTGVIEDRTPYDNNVEMYGAQAAKRSGHLFSPLPYWQEAMKTNGLQPDLFAHLMTAGQDTSQVCHQHGVITFENMDYREQDLPTALTASGIDLTNVGGLDVNMRWYHFAGDADDAATADYQFIANALTSKAANRGETLFNIVGTSGTGLSTPPNNGQWRLGFMLAYDAVYEVSPSGITDITNAVL